MLKQLKTALIFLLLMSLITGIIYPLIITGVAQVMFPNRSNGSFITRNGNIVGSALIGQPFNDPKYFWGRPSATAPFPYNAMESSGSNLALSNPLLLTMIQNRIHTFQQADSTTTIATPPGLLTASGSGLDPDISPQDAIYQMRRVAQARGISEDKVYRLVQKYIKTRQWWIFGEPRVNVLQLNIALDALGKE